MSLARQLCDVHFEPLPSSQTDSQPRSKTRRDQPKPVARDRENAHTQIPPHPVMLTVYVRVQNNIKFSHKHARALRACACVQEARRGPTETTRAPAQLGPLDRAFAAMHRSSMPEHACSGEVLLAVEELLDGV